MAIAFGVLTLGLDLAVVPLDSLTHRTGPGGPVLDRQISFSSAVALQTVGRSIGTCRGEVL